MQKINFRLKPNKRNGENFEWRDIMKRRFFKTLTSLILGFGLVFGFNSNVQALETQIDFNENPFLAGKAIDINDINIDYKLIKKLPTSLGIDKINIDIDSLHDTNPLTLSDKSVLLSKGYDPMKIDSMDRGDFLKLKDTWNLSPEVIKAAKVIYPELNNLDLSTWTYGKYYKYSKIKDDEKYRPMPEQINQFRGRGITLADARYMLKDFNNYQAILNLSDDEIKEYLLGYYKFKETYAKTLKGIERNKKDSNNKASFRISATSKIIDGATYYYCYVPGYGYDWFHETSQTHVGINSDMYGADAQQIFEAIYPSGGSKTKVYIKTWTFMNIKLS